MNGRLVNKADGSPLQVSSTDFYVENGILKVRQYTPEESTKTDNNASALALLANISQSLRKYTPPADAAALQQGENASQSSLPSTERSLSDARSGNRGVAIAQSLVSYASATSPSRQGRTLLQTGSNKCPQCWVAGDSSITTYTAAQLRLTAANGGCQALKNQGLRALGLQSFSCTAGALNSFNMTTTGCSTTGQYKSLVNCIDGASGTRLSTPVTRRTPCVVVNDLVTSKLQKFFDTPVSCPTDSVLTSWGVTSFSTADPACTAWSGGDALRIEYTCAPVSAGSSLVKYRLNNGLGCRPILVWNRSVYPRLEPLCCHPSAPPRPINPLF